MINVTKSQLPSLATYISYLEKVWESGQITNFGPLVLELEERLKEFLQVKHLFFVTNGTTALQVAIKASGIKGEVITTPFSYVATTASIVWENATPVFVDIDQQTFCIDPTLIEKAITKSTSAILATHVYGNPCAVEEIQSIAKKNQLKVIYDAAHAFNVQYKGQSVLNYGDVSTLSFHATKLFHTCEGGAIITNDDALAHTISYHMNFGHNGPEEFFGLGINGKNSEFHAAMGLSLLPDVPFFIEKRKQVFCFYDQHLKGLPLKRPLIESYVKYNYAYYPVVFDTEGQLLVVKKALQEHDIFPRRYFYPALTQLNYVRSGQLAPIAEDIASRILCLPLSTELTDEVVKYISDIIRKSLR